MGGNQSTLEQQQNIPTINHSKFQNVQFLKGNQVMKIILSLDNYSDFQKWEEQLDKVAKFNDQVLLLPKQYKCLRRAVCSSSAVLHIEYDNYPYILQDELQNRFKIQKHFSQQEIWYLLYSLCQATHYFFSINSKVGDIRPTNIFINEDGQIKVSNLFSWPCQTTNYDKTIFDKQLTYISPQQVEGTKDGKVQIFIDKYKAQSFSIGITILETGLLQSCKKLYNPKTNTFSRYQLTKIIKQWWDLIYDDYNEQTQNTTQQQYSIELKLVVAALCDINVDQRLTSENVYNWLKPYKDEINNLKRFNIGLPTLQNIKKYQPFLIKYKKKKYINQQNQNIKINKLQPQKLYQQPIQIYQQNNNNILKQQNNHTYVFFKNTADSHQYKNTYTPNQINPVYQSDKFKQIAQINSYNKFNQHVGVINNQISYPSNKITQTPLPLFTSSQQTSKNFVIKTQPHTTQLQRNNNNQIKSNNDFLKRIELALTKSRQNNPS